MGSCGGVLLWWLCIFVHRVINEIKRFQFINLNMSKNDLTSIEKRLEAIENGVFMAGITAKEILTFDEAALYLGLSKSYLYKLTSGQKIPHYKPAGKMVYFNRRELETWLQQNRVSTMTEINTKAQSYCMKKGGRVC